MPIGDVARRTRTVSFRDIELFTEITGDRNPLHYDEELAAASRFGSIIVQGGVTSGLLNAVVAEDLPGPGSVFLQVDWRFLHAVRPGDTITAVDGDTVKIRRDGDTATVTAEGKLPLVASVTDQTGEARYPSFKGIMAAKKKPVETWSLSDLGVDAGEVGLSVAWSQVEDTTERPPRTAGEIVTDEDGSGAGALVDFLASKKFI